MKKVFAGLLAGLLALPASAQDVAEALSLGRDSYGAGRAVTLSDEGRDDVFLAGERLRLASEISGTAHMAGRWVEIDAPVGADVYALGQRITITAPVAGDVSAAAQRIRIEAEIGGDLRAAGSEMSLDAPVMGTAVLTGEIVNFDATVSGDVVLSVNEVDWGNGAEIGGSLVIYEEVLDTISVPASVIAPDRIERRGLSGNPLAPDLFGETAKQEAKNARRALGLPKAEPEPEPLPTGFLSGVLVLALIGAALSVIWPRSIAAMRREVLGRPLRALTIGFVGLSTAIGATVLLAITVIGLFVAPVMVLAGVLLWVLGYAVATYAVGVWALSWFGGGDPITNGERAMSAGVGALAVGLLGLIPYLGWLLLIVLPLMGAGAALLRWLRPGLFVQA